MKKGKPSHEAIVARFWSKVDKKGPNGCWEWMAGQNGAGYGVYWLSVDGYEQACHRFSMVLHLGRVLRKGEWVLHKCDNPSCVNPDHLFLGDNNANMKDMVAKGRKPSGEKHHKAKMSVKKIKEMIVLYETGEWTYQELADKFGVCLNTIVNAMKGTYWKMIERKVCRDNRAGRKMPSVNQGEKCAKAKLKESDIPTIVEMRKSGMLFKQIALQYGVSGESIAAMFRGKRWGHHPSLKEYQ